MSDREVDVRLERVTKRFDDVVAVDDISLEIEHGSFFALLGPSGCGKTTTLRMIGGFEEPTEGAIYLGDGAGRPASRRTSATSTPSSSRTRSSRTFRSSRTSPSACAAAGSARQEVARARARASSTSSASRGWRSGKPRQLSGGQQQRVALARALVNRPRVLLLDEPLGALDLKLRKQMQLELKAIQHDVGITFVHVTHDQEEAMTMADRIAVMNQGHVEQLGPPDGAVRAACAPRSSPAFSASRTCSPASSRAPVRVRLAEGTLVQAQVDGKSGPVAAGVRPEKITPRRGRRPEPAFGEGCRDRLHRRRDAARRRYAGRHDAGFRAEHRLRQAAFRRRARTSR